MQYLAINFIFFLSMCQVVLAQDKTLHRMDREIEEPGRFYYKNSVYRSSVDNKIYFTEGSKETFDESVLCPQLKARYDQVKRFSEIYQSKKTSVPFECKCESQGSRFVCGFAISDILKDLSNIHGQNVGYGPNCYNSALFLSGLLPSKRYSGPEEVEFWLNSQFCHQLSPEDVLEPGDIQVVRYNGVSSNVPTNILHTMTYLAKDLLFSKNGKDDSYLFMTQERVHSPFVYPLQEGCTEVVSSTTTGGECLWWINAYRCQNPTSSLASMVSKSSTKVQQAYNKTQKLDCEFNSNLKPDIKNQVNVLIAYAKDEIVRMEAIDTKSLSPKALEKIENEKYLMKKILVQNKSMHEQLEIKPELGGF